LVASATAALAYSSTRAILLATDGVPAVPLDDTFIHFQFARSFAELTPFVYSPGTAPVPGATSLLWPLLLAPFHAFGVRELNLIWVAWSFGWLALGLLAWDTAKLARGLVGREAAWAAGVMALGFGGHIWYAGSGMEVVPLAWLLIRSARFAAEWSERRSGAEGEKSAACASNAELRAGLLLGGASALMRPEGALASLLIGLTWLALPRGRARLWALPVLLAPLIPGSVNWLFTGHFATTTAEVKWLFFSPYPAHVPAQLSQNVQTFFETLLDGRIWSALFVPQGAKWVTWIALPALLLQGFVAGRRWRAACVLIIALGMLAPITYDSFLVNRLRYLWPFTAAWFIAFAALAELIGDLLGRVRPELGSARVVAAGLFAGAVVAPASRAMDDLAESAAGIHKQQVALALWARERLPEGASIGLNDAGAITYLSGHRTFDVVGLTTRSEGRFWRAGAGSRYEHYERLGAGALPSHLIVYERWFAIEGVLGTYLTERSVPGATILGDVTKTAFVADWRALGAADRPAEGAGRTLVDELDVSDLESEAAHGYELFWAQQWENLAFEGSPGRVDGGRASRSVESFSLELAPGGTLVARLASSLPTRLNVELEGRASGAFDLNADRRWEEVSLPLPRELAPGKYRVTISAPSGTTFTALRYWSYRD
jgi:hypothetical protein